LATYRALLARRDEPQDGDADRLRDVMAAMGLTPDDVKADSAALSKAADLDGKILGPDALAALKADHAAAVEQWQADAKKLMCDCVDTFQLHQLERAMSIIVMSSSLSGAANREAELRERGQTIGSGFYCATGSQESYRQQAAAIRAKNPRAFAD
jgi:sigma54-dependent transcription regulator